MRTTIPILLASVLVAAVVPRGALAMPGIGTAGVQPAAHLMSRVSAPNQDSKEVRDLLSPHGRGSFSVQFRLALDTFQKAEELYFAAKYKRCKQELEDLWGRFPPGTSKWAGLRSPIPEVFVGNPACYYALRMLTDVVDWRLQYEKAPFPPDALTLTVILVGRSHGVEPRSMSELEAGTGQEVDHSLDPLLLQDNHLVIHQSLRLFGEYVRAVTGGHLEMQVEILHLEDVVVPVYVATQPPRKAGLEPGAEWTVWEAIPRKVRKRTDWWWLLYPSHVPEQFPGFDEMGFYVGGMGVGPDRQSPLFVIDDRMLVRALQKPLGRGLHSEFERRAYLPQWLQHEFFHHLFRTYPELELEKESHQWFDRTTWPGDFEGLLEPDYYRESLNKRLMAVDPPLHVSLRYRGPDAETLLLLDPDALLGYYERRPVENDWHIGRIVTTSKIERGVRGLRWVNKAEQRWDLERDVENGRLFTGPESGDRSFEIVLRRGHDGRHVPELVGFSIQGELYTRVDPSLDKASAPLARLVEAIAAGDRREAKTLVRDFPSTVRNIGERLIAADRNRSRLSRPSKVRAKVKSIPLTDTRASSARVGWLEPAFDRVPDPSALLASGGEVFAHGLYAHAPSRFSYFLGRKWSILRGGVGMHDGHHGSVVFVIAVDGEERWRSEIIEHGSLTRFEVDLTRASRVELLVEDAGDGKDADWGLWLEPMLER